MDASSVRWARVALFYALAFGWVSLVAAALYGLGARDFGASGAAVFAQLAVAFLYMPAPLIAALLVERLDGRGYLISHTFDGFGRKLWRLVATCVAVALGTYAVMLLLTWVLGNVLGVPGVGVLALTPQALAENVAVLAPEGVSEEALAEVEAQLPSVWMLLFVSLLAGILAGFTINGVFGFGEEYGWRGWLMDELRPMGPVPANVLTGVLWGLWHTPLILMGFNFSPYNVVGPLFMVVLCVPFSFLLWRARDFTGSMLAPAVIHGVFNGFAGAFVLLVADRNPLVAVPTGVVAATAIGLVAGILWRVSAGRLRPTVAADSGAVPGDRLQESNGSAASAALGNRLGEAR